MSAQPRFYVPNRFLLGLLWLGLSLILLATMPVPVQAKALAVQPPPAPQLIAPIDRANVASLTPKLSWTKSAGASYYRLLYSTSQDFSSGVHERIAFTASYTFLMTDSLSFGDTYFWKVEAYLTDDVTYSTSTVRRFTLTFQKTPINGAYSTASSLTFTWAAVPGATGYKLIQYAPFPPYLNTLYSGPLTKYTLPDPDQGTLVWQVCVMLIGGGNMCTQNWVVIVTPPLPPAPLLISPPTGTLFHKEGPGSHHYFSIQELAGTVAGWPFEYQFQIDTSSSFAHPIVDTKGASTLDYVGDFPDGKYYWRARAVNYCDAAGKWSATRWFVSDTISPPGPLLISPADSTTTTSTRPTFKWAKSPGAVSYRLYIESPNLGAPIDKPGIKSTSYTPTLAEVLPAGEIYWRVYATDAANNETPIASTQYFGFVIVGSLPPGTVPAAPQLISPANGTLTNVAPTLKWSLANGISSSQLEVSSDPAFTAPDMYLIVSDDQLTPSLASDGTYFWRVHVNNGSYNSPWSKVWSFKLKTAAPAVPKFIVPVYGSYLSGRRPTFSWTAVPGAVSYTLTITVNGNPLPAVNTKKTSYTPSKPLDFGQIGCDVVAHDAFGNVSDSGLYYSFIPLQLSPANGSHTSNPRPTFKWAAYPGASSYNLKIISNVEINKTDITGTSYKPDVDLAGSSAWYVFVNGISSPTDTYVFSFSITRSVPVAPKLLEPPDKIATANSTPSFLWNSVPNASEYYFQVSLSPNFSQPHDFLPYFVIGSPGATYGADIDLAGILAPPDQTPTYYWRVRAQNSDDAFGPWSLARSLTLDLTNPAHPWPLNPQDGGAVTNPQLKLSWSGVPDAAGYEVVFAFGSSLPDPSDPAFPPPTRLGKVTSYKLPVTIEEGPYSWQVRAYDAAGNYSDWSPVYTFTMLAGQSLPKTPTPTPTPTPTSEPSPTPTPTEPAVEPSAKPPAPTVEPTPTTAEPITEPSPTPTP